MTTVIARDATASDQLVYAWPFPLGGHELDVVCTGDEVVILSNGWLVGDRLGPGRHRWRAADPHRPVAAYFVATQAVEVSFACETTFTIPATQQQVTLQAEGSVLVRSTDAAVLVAQFVGLPFDNVNDGIVRSVQRSCERLVTRTLVRRVIMGGSLNAVTDEAVWPSIMEELFMQNMAAGAVFGLECARLLSLHIFSPGQAPVQRNPRAASEQMAAQMAQPAVAAMRVIGDASSDDETQQGLPPVRPGIAVAGPREVTPPLSVPAMVIPGRRDLANSGPTVSGEIGRKDVALPAIPRPGAPRQAASMAVAVASTSAVLSAVMPAVSPTDDTGKIPRQSADSSGDLEPWSADTAEHSATLRMAAMPSMTGAFAASSGSGAHDVPAHLADGSGDERPARESSGIIGIGAGIGTGMGIGIGIGAGRSGDTASSANVSSAQGSIASGEIVERLEAGSRVLVPGGDGRMVSAVIKQEQAGYYEVEVGGSEEIMWLPVANVVAEGA